MIPAKPGRNYEQAVKAFEPYGPHRGGEPGSACGWQGRGKGGGTEAQDVSEESTETYLH